MSERILSIIAEQAEQATEEDRQGELARHMVAHPICTQRHRITGLLNTLGRDTYTEPAYLACTDVHTPIEELIQSYFWRWGIEVKFKEEKQLFQTAIR